MSNAAEEKGGVMDARKFRILLVDPSKKLQSLIEKSLGDSVSVERAGTADTALQMLALQGCDLIVLQLQLPIFSGIELARRLKKLRPEIPLLTACPSSSTEDAEEIVRMGYSAPVNLPGEETELIARCKEVLNGEGWLRKSKMMREEFRKSYGFDQILSLDAEMRIVHQQLKKVCASRVPVLITGESGTGKELVSRMVHITSERSKRPFITVNCAAVPEGLLESQFFGHEKGAFTGAVGRTPGKFELAHTGTLFLDEVGELSPALQAKLLRVLEYGEFERVGGIETLKVDVRLITATNRNLDTMVAAGTFRGDLYYRINVFPIQLPPLRERGDDIIMLAYHFLSLASQRNNRQVRAIRARALDLLRRYPWPGNIRELENAIERAMLLSDGIRLKAEDFPAQFDWSLAQGETPLDDEEITSSIRPLVEVEREAVKKAIEVTAGNIALAARKLGIARGTLYKKMEEHGLACRGEAPLLEATNAKP